MQGFDHTQYVPIILTKRGERAALSALPAEVSQLITPLFVVPPVDWDFENESPKKSLAEHLAPIPQQLVDCWTLSQAFVDLMFLDDEPAPSGDHGLVWLTEQAEALGLTLIPVVSPNRTSAYIQAAKTVVARQNQGVCVRLSIMEWPEIAGFQTIERTLGEVGVQPVATHLVLDLGDDVGDAAAVAVASELRALPHLTEWASVAVVGTGMPATMPAGQGVHVVERSEWRIYESLAQLTVPLQRTPSFGDYVIASTSPVVDVDPKYMNISATLRYTSREDWLIAKGGLFKGNGGKGVGGAAVPPVAAKLVDHPEFFGVGHCGFDDWLISVASSGAGGGNPETWRRQATEHHMTVVTGQLASLYGT